MTTAATPDPPAGAKTDWQAAMRRATFALVARRRPAWPLAIMRILFGVVLLAWTVSMMFDAADLLGGDAIVPIELADSGGWRWLDLDSTGVVWVALVTLVLASVAVIVGWRPTGWLLVAFVVLVAVQRRNPTILNSGDLLLRNLALLLACTPTGAALSVDRWRRHGRDALRTAPLVAPWGLRLIQLQLVVIYLAAVWSKYGVTWRDGTAVSTVLRLEDLERFAAPSWLIGNVVLIAMFTWGTLAIELALATLLWVRSLRPLLIGLGVVLHLAIDVFILVGFFGPLMITALVSFADTDRLGARVGRTLARA